jgi:diacylglycerol kinase (ATP)
MGPIKVILNPRAGRGYGARIEPALRESLQAEGIEFDLVRTAGPGHAVELAEQAVGDGFDIIVAAGGDGTAHEVVNGLMATSDGREVGTLGIIPVGSGSDFANNVGVPPDLQGACRRLACGQRRTVDVCRIAVDGQPACYFDNTVNIGFGGVVTREALKVKWLRGIALYLPVVLKTVFLYYKALPTTIEYDGQVLEMQTVMIAIANGPREGGGFYVAPQAQPDDGLLDLCIVREMGRLGMLAVIPDFMKGTHVGHKKITMLQTRKVTISSPDDLIAHADGEMLCTEAHRLEFEILPRRLRVLCLPERQQ